MDKPLKIVANTTPPTLIGGRRKREPTLSNLREVKQELASLYRACRYRNEIDPGDAAKLAFMLVSLGKIIESHDLEERLDRLENRRNDEHHFIEED